MGDDPSDVSPLAGSAALRSLAVRWPRALSFNGITLWAPHSPPVLTVFAHRCRPPALPPPQVASRKVKQLIVLVDKMEQAQSALELKLRGTEVRPPALILLLFKSHDRVVFLALLPYTRWAARAGEAQVGAGHHNAADGGVGGCQREGALRVALSDYLLSLLRFR